MESTQKIQKRNPRFLECKGVHSCSLWDRNRRDQQCANKQEDGFACQVAPFFMLPNRATSVTCVALLRLKIPGSA